jgi:hypothetical protein
MQIHYEEKTFESYFDAELAKKDIFYFPPGQVQEGSIGADSVVWNKSRWLWRRLGHPYFWRVPFEGASYREIAEEMELQLNREIRDIPNIRANLFFQFKRSERMVHKSAEEWKHWNQAYFRYEIYKQQHDLLAILHKRFAGEVLVLYAAPLVEDVNQLVDLHISGRIVSNTNFRPACELTGHHRNTLIAPGGHSVACSEPLRLEPFDLNDAIKLSKLSQTETIRSFSQIAEVVENTMLDSAFRISFKKLKEANAFNRYIEDLPLLKVITTMTIFREITGIQWTAVAE